jgi:hypothetical protein
LDYLALELLGLDTMEGRSVLACQDFNQAVQILPPLRGGEVRLLLGHAIEDLR